MMKTQTATSGTNRWPILVLGLATALIHLILLNISLGKVDLLFTLNGLAYLALLAAYFLPLPFAKDNHGLVRWALMGFTALTIIAWAILGRPYTTLGYLTKLIELGLIVFLWMDKRPS
jgi:hypothetical protein